MKRHQVVILLGCLIAAGMCLYPPMIGVQYGHRDEPERFIGYRRLDKERDEELPVRPQEVGEDIGMYNLRAALSTRYTPTSVLRSHLDTQRLAVQLVGVLILTFGLAFALRRNIA